MDNPSTTVVGLDVSARWTHVFRMERDSPDKGERSKLRTRESPLEEYFRSLPPRSTIILEVGPHSRWIYHLIDSCGMGHEAIVANARKLRFIYAGTCKTDQLDAESLTRVGCLQPQLLYPIHHRSPAAQKDLNVLQARDTLVQVRTKLINTLRGLIKASGLDLDDERGLRTPSHEDRREAQSHQRVERVANGEDRITGIVILVCPPVRGSSSGPWHRPSSCS